ncbi:MAG: hypothetical protein Q8P49_01955, partial [Candidatus Liptonbacteria bacterium]|nr:hypothetical protein [Candidatus Liptonbacteria bacterium]
MRYFSSRVFIGAALFLGLGALGVNFALAQTTVLQLPPAGGSYVDPITGKTVYRLTDRQLCPAGAHHIYSDTFEHSSYGTIVRCGYDRTNTNVWRWVLIGPDHKTVLFSDLTTTAKAPTSANNFHELQWLPDQKRILGRNGASIYELDPWNGVTKLYVQMPTIGTTACRFDWRVNPQGHVVAHTGNKLTMCIFDPATGIVSTKDVGSIASNPDQTSALWNGKGLFTWNKNPQRAWDPDFSNEIIFDDFHGHLGQFRDAGGQWYTVNTKEDKLASGGVGQIGCPGIAWRPEMGIYNASTGKRVLIWGCDQPAGAGGSDRDHWTTASAINRFASSGHTSIALWDVDWTTGKVSRTELARTHTTLPDGSKPYWGTPRATANYDLTEVLFTSGMCDGQVLETDGSVKKCPANIVLDTDLYIVA